MSSARVAVAGILLLGLLARSGAAQDSVLVRHLLALDLSRLQPFERTYDMIVRTGDSSSVIGERTVAARPTSYAGSEAWVIVESRTGMVPSAESLYVSSDFRPLHWSATLGPARLATEFVGDSMLGAAGAGRSKQNIVLPGRPDMLVNGAMVETMLALLPLAETWNDSAAVVSVNLASATLVPAELVVVATEEYPIDSASVVPVWVVTLRTAETSVVYWADRTTGVPLRVQQPVPAHVGSLLEFRLRHTTVPPG